MRHPISKPAVATPPTSMDVDVASASRPVKHSFTINGHRTSISLEAAFWEALKRAAGDLAMPVATLVAQIDAGRGEAGLSSAVRVWLLSRLEEKSVDRR